MFCMIATGVAVSVADAAVIVAGVAAGWPVATGMVTGAQDCTWDICRCCWCRCGCGQTQHVLPLVRCSLVLLSLSLLELQSWPGAADCCESGRHCSRRSGGCGHGQQRKTAIGAAVMRSLVLVSPWVLQGVAIDH